MSKIPPQSQKVFTGEIFDVYQWEQQMYDGSKATFEILDRANSLQTIAIIDNTIAINYEQQPSLGSFYSLPGGRQEKNEEELTGAQRELKEETGLVSTNWAELFRFDVTAKINWEIIIFVAKNCIKESITNPDPGEKIQTHFFSFEKFVQIVLSDQFYDIHFKYELLKKKHAGTLEEFKKQLFS